MVQSVAVVSIQLTLPVLFNAAVVVLHFTLRWPPSHFFDWQFGHFTGGVRIRDSHWWSHFWQCNGDGHNIAILASCILSAWSRASTSAIALSAICLICFNFNIPQYYFMW